MMTRRDDPLDNVFELIDNVLGQVEELSSDDIDKLLAEAGIDTDAIKRRLYERAVELCGKYWARQVDPPAHLLDFLHQL